MTAEDLLAAIGPALVAGDPLPRPESRGDAVDPAEVAAIAGRYGLDSGGSFEVERRDDRLAIAAHGADAVEALFPLPNGYTTGDVAAHEQAVRALLAGETAEGQEERAAIESDLGPIGDIALMGTIVREDELRTYVTVTAGDDSLLFWYALDEEGGIAAAEAGTEPPTQLLVTSGEGAYRPDDPTGTAPELTVTFASDQMSVAGPAGTVSARRVG